MALMKQFALGREVRAPIIRVVIVKTVVTPAEQISVCLLFTDSQLVDSWRNYFYWVQNINKTQ